jgi:hypothetical protein
MLLIGEYSIGVKCPLNLFIRKEVKMIYKVTDLNSLVRISFVKSIVMQMANDMERVDKKHNIQNEKRIYLQTAWKNYKNK